MSATLDIQITVNGQQRSLTVQAHHTLMRVLREQLNLTGTKECCSEGECGACTVLLDGSAVTSCLVLAAEANGSEVTTIEGLAPRDPLDSLQTSFIREGAVQCGFCIPGMIMSAKYLLMTIPDPTVDQIKQGLAGNLCRCAGYSRIIEAVANAALKGKA